jgi:OOP family OmpA-OmpF porin
MGAGRGNFCHAFPKGDEAMTKPFSKPSARNAIGAAVAVSLAAFAGAAHAVPGYVTYGQNQAVFNSVGQCYKTSDWTPDKAAEPCDAVPRAAAPVPPVAVAPAPAPVAPPPRVIEKVTLSTDVLFEFNKAELLPGGQKKLDELADTAKGADVERVVIIGNADRIGSEEYNQELSERRALAVKDYLAQKGVPEQQVQAEGVGKSQPVTGDQCKNMGPERKSNSKLVACLQPDRRVEIEVLGQRESTSTGAGTPSGDSTSGSSSSR